MTAETVNSGGRNDGVSDGVDVEVKGIIDVVDRSRKNIDVVSRNVVIKNRNRVMNGDGGWDILDRQDAITVAVILVVVGCRGKSKWKGIN